MSFFSHIFPVPFYDVMSANNNEQKALDNGGGGREGGFGGSGGSGDSSSSPALNEIQDDIQDPTSSGKPKVNGVKRQRKEKELNVLFNMPNTRQTFKEGNLRKRHLTDIFAFFWFCSTGKWLSCQMELFLTGGGGPSMCL